MARLIYALNQSLDGVIDHDAFMPEPALFRHFIDDVASLAGSIYGRIMYETMRYWDGDDPDWGEPEREYAMAWRRQPKWVVSRSLDAVGPNATLVNSDIEAVVREIRATVEGKIEVAGPRMAESAIGWGLLDEIAIYLHPVVVGSGKSFFRGEVPPLKLLETRRFGENVVRLRYELAG